MQTNQEKIFDNMFIQADTDAQKNYLNTSEYLSLKEKNRLLIALFADIQTKKITPTGLWVKNALTATMIASLVATTVFIPPATPIVAISYIIITVAAAKIVECSYNLVNAMNPANSPTRQQTFKARAIATFKELIIISASVTIGIFVAPLITGTALTALMLLGAVVTSAVVSHYSASAADALVQKTGVSQGITMLSKCLKFISKVTGGPKFLIRKLIEANPRRTTPVETLEKAFYEKAAKNIFTTLYVPLRPFIELIKTQEARTAYQDQIIRKKNIIEMIATQNEKDQAQGLGNTATLHQIEETLTYAQKKIQNDEKQKPASLEKRKNHKLPNTSFHKEHLPTPMKTSQHISQNRVIPHKQEHINIVTNTKQKYQNLQKQLAKLQKLSNKLNNNNNKPKKP